MDFVDDHRADPAQDLATALSGDHQVERFRCGDQELRRPTQHRGALTRCGIPAADRDPDLRDHTTEFFRDLCDLGDGFVEILLDVDPERFERRDIHHLGAFLLGGVEAEVFAALRGGLVETVDADQKRREGLAGTGGRCDQRVDILRDRRPTLDLGFRRPLRKLALEPGPNRGMKRFQN